MTRLVLTIGVPLVLPSLAYLLWLRATGRFMSVGGLAALPWPWMIASGVGLAALTLVVLNLGYGSSPAGTYVPPHVENGRVVPGHVVTEPKP